MQKSLYVWDIVVRSFHWLLVLAFALAFATEDFSVLHAYIGYFILGLIAVRLLWGVIGSKHARFSDFIYRPRVIKQYLKDLFFKRAKHYVGHNPAGGLMIVLMLISLILTAVTGHYAYESEVFMIYAEHESWLEEVHEALAFFSLTLVFVHVVGVLLESVLHGENLISAMISGWKRRSE